MLNHKSILRLVSVQRIASIPQVEYRWISYYDEEREKRFSDWPHAIHCQKCNAKIVHIYTVNGLEIGKECMLLGITESRLRAAQKRFFASR
jgi:hypothetical protein